MDFIRQLCDYFDTNEMTDVYLVMDNVRFHKTQVRDLIEERGHHPLYLPPYSPFLDPIENLFSQWKGMIRRREPNNETELYAAVHSTSEQITAEHCLNYVRNMEKYISKSLTREVIFN